MVSFRSIQWCWICFIIGQYVEADWPLSNSSNIQLLGLFAGELNRPELTTSALHAPAMFKAAVVLSQLYNITIEGQHIGWQSEETKGDMIDALSKTCQSISNSNIVGIVGPELSRESHFIAPFAAKIGIPVISYASTDPELSNRKIYPAFYRTVPSDNAAALALMNLFLLFNWTSCLVIYQNDAFGSGGIKAINEAFSKHQISVTETIVFDITTFTFQGNLKYLLNKSSMRIVLVWAVPYYTKFILQNALDNDVVGPQFTWILSSNIALNRFDQTSFNKLNGILIIEPVVGDIVDASINNSLLQAAYKIWETYEPYSCPKSDEIDPYALFAFDATWTLILALQKFCLSKSSHSLSCLSLTNTSFCFDRKLFNSTLLFDIINNSTFLGVSGSVSFSEKVTDRMSGTYYIAKNLQHSSNKLNNIPVLVWSESNGWSSYRQNNVIVWPGHTLLPPSGYASVSGVILRIAVVESKPFTMTRETTDESGQINRKSFGYIPDLIEALRIKMGFITNITILPINQSYNGLIDAIVNDVYDMVVADVTITAKRTQRVAFSSSIFDNSLRIIIRKTPTENIDLLSYLRPFSFQLWITLLFASIYAGFLICLLEYEHNAALKGKSMSSLIIKSMWYSIGTVLGYGADFHVQTAAGRLLTMGLYILSLVSVAAYTAKLASELTIAKSQSVISGIDDLKNGKIPFTRIGIVTNTSIEEYYLREISGDSRNFYPLRNDQEMYEKLLNKIIDASIMDSGVIEYSTNNIYCDLTLVGTDFDKNAFGIVFPKDWLYQQFLDINILSLRESGKLDELKRKWFQTNVCSRTGSIFDEMTIESMAGLFLTFGMISLLSFLVFLWIKRWVIRDYLLLFLHRKKLTK